MSDTGSHKLRALFLAAVMVTSIFAGVAGTASAETLDRTDGTPPQDLSSSDSLGNAEDITLQNTSDSNDESILINASSFTTNVTFGYNTSNTSAFQANFTVTNSSGTVVLTGQNVTSDNSIGGPIDAQNTADNGTFNLSNNLANGEQFTLNASLFNTTSQTTNASAKNVTVETFAVDNDNTTSQFVNAERTVEVADLDVNASRIDSVDVNLNGSNSDNLTTAQIQTVTAKQTLENGNIVFNDSSYTNLDGENLDIQDGVNTTKLEILATTSSSASNGTIIDANVTANVGQLNTTVETQNTQTVNTDNLGVLSGTVSIADTTRQIKNAVIQVNNTDTNTRVNTGTTSATGSYSISVGGDANYSVNVIETNDPDNINLNNYDIQPELGGDGQVFVERGSSVGVDINLIEQLRPTTLNITNVAPSSQSVQADNSTEIVVTANVEDQDGDNLGAVDVNASIPSSTVFFNGSSLKTTGSDGDVTFRVFANTSQTVDIDVRVDGTTTNALNKQRTLTFTPTFREAQQGAITGDVREATTGDKIEGAQVHAVYTTSVQNNQKTFTYNFSTNSPTNNTASFRLLNLTSGGLVDSDEYAVSIADSDATGNFSFVNGADDARVLNSSDSTVGTGFQVTNLTDSNSGNPDVNLTVTSLATGNLSIQQANTDAPANSDFSNISAPLSNSFAPSANITYADAEFRSANTDQQLADETDADGDYDLTQLHTDGSNGFGYYIVVQQPGLSTEIENVGTVDPANSPFTQGTTYLEPRDAPPVDNVNITNLGLAESDGGDITEPFENTTDDFAQEVPRDGTYDVVEVETTVSDTGAVGNGTVTLEVPDNSSADSIGTSSNDISFTGDFTTVENGTEISSGEDTITIATGDNGFARVYLQTDSSTVDLNASAMPNTDETGIDADLQGTSSEDFTNKSFVGVTSFTTGSISGVVTDENNEELPGAELFVTGIDSDTDGTDEFSIERLGENNNGTLEFEVNRTTTGESEVVTASELDSYEFDAFATVTTSEPVDLRTAEASSTYTLATVPADDDGVDLTIAGVAGGVNGTSVPGTVTTDATGSANVQINTELTSSFEVSNVAPDGASVDAGDNITVTAEIENTGNADGTQDIEFRLDTSGDGTLDSSETLATNDSFSVDDGETRTVTFADVSTDSLSAGTYTHGVVSDDDQATASITIKEPASASANVTFTDQTVTNGTETVTVDNANYTLADGSAGDYVVVAHVVNDDGSISSPVGYSGDVSGDTDDITVDLNASEAQGDALDTLTADTTLRAMLHNTSSDSAFGDALEIGGVKETADADITVEDEDLPANFDVSEIQPEDATVNVSEAFDVSATVENTGDLQGEQDVELRLEPDGSAVENQTVDLDAGNSTTVTFEDVTVDTEGEYNHTIASANDSATGSLTVTAADEDEPSSVAGWVETSEITEEQYRAFDTDGSGSLTPDEVRAGVSEFAQGGLDSVGDTAFTPDQISELVSQFAQNEL